jgi:hypothetical protein
MKAHPITEYPARCQQAAAIMLMIQNNLDPCVAQYPEELITYGGNGSVFQVAPLFFRTLSTFIATVCQMMLFLTMLRTIKAVAKCSNCRTAYSELGAVSFDYEVLIRNDRGANLKHVFR